MHIHGFAHRCREGLAQPFIGAFAIQPPPGIDQVAGDSACGEYPSIGHLADINPPFGQGMHGGFERLKLTGVVDILPWRKHWRTILANQALCEHHRVAGLFSQRNHRANDEGVGLEFVPIHQVFPRVAALGPDIGLVENTVVIGVLSWVQDAVSIEVFVCCFKQQGWAVPTGVIGEVAIRLVEILGKAAMAHIKANGLEVVWGVWLYIDHKECVVGVVAIVLVAGLDFVQVEGRIEGHGERRVNTKADQLIHFTPRFSLHLGRGQLRNIDAKAGHRCGVGSRCQVVWEGDLW